MSLDQHDTATTSHVHTELISCSNCGLSVILVGERHTEEPAGYVVYKHDEFFQCFSTEEEFKDWMEENAPEHTASEEDEQDTLDVVSMLRAVTKAAILEHLRQQYGADNLPDDIEEKIDDVLDKGHELADDLAKHPREGSVKEVLSTADSVFDEFIESLDLPDVNS